jgi:FkbM family methyltransferase
MKPEVFYAQNSEDKILWQALEDVENGFYVDVGAGWPDRDSVTKSFYEAGWDGINIEPSPDEYRALHSQRLRDINLQIAAGARSGPGFYYSYPERGIYSRDPIVREPLEKAGIEGHEVKLPIKPLSEILSRFRPKGEIHFLKIDVEGSEGEVLAGMNFRLYRPWIALVEATWPHTQVRCDLVWDHYLLDNGYRFAYFDGLNAYYVADEHSELIPAIKRPE